MIAEQREMVTKNYVSGYELTYTTIHNLSKYNITPTAKLVLVLLTTHYNEAKNNNIVFPSMPYISETLGIGLTATKAAIKDLIEEGLIIKSKRSKVRGNLNKYALTNKIKSTKSDRFKRSESDRFMITSKEKLNKKTTTNKNEVSKCEKNVVAFSSNSFHKKVTLADVPDIIKNDKKIIKPCAYWASLDDETKQEKLKENNEKKQKEIRIAKMKEDNEKKRIQEQKEWEESKKQVAFWNEEEFTREKGIEYIKSLPVDFRSRSKTCKNIKEKFNITDNDIC